MDWRTLFGKSQSPRLSLAETVRERSRIGAEKKRRADIKMADPLYLSVVQTVHKAADKGNNWCCFNIVERFEYCPEARDIVKRRLETEGFFITRQESGRRFLYPMWYISWEKTN